jgi:hypothetical protein
MWTRYSWNGDVGLSGQSMRVGTRREDPKLVGHIRQNPRPANTYLLQQDGTLRLCSPIITEPVLRVRILHPCDQSQRDSSNT